MSQRYSLLYICNNTLVGTVNYYEPPYKQIQYSHAYVCPTCGKMWAWVEAYEHPRGQFPQRFIPWSHYCRHHGGGSLLALEGTPWHEFREPEHFPKPGNCRDFLFNAVLNEFQLPLRSYCLQYNKAPGAFDDNDQQPEISYVQKST